MGWINFGTLCLTIMTDITWSISQLLKLKTTLSLAPSFTQKKTYLNGLRKSQEFLIQGRVNQNVKYSGIHNDLPKVNKNKFGAGGGALFPIRFRHFVIVSIKHPKNFMYLF